LESQNKTYFYSLSRLFLILISIFIFVENSFASNGFSTVFEIFQLGFNEPIVNETWSEGGSYDAKTNLLDQSQLPVSWSITTTEGQEATIDNNGIVNFGSSEGKYTLQATFSLNPLCVETMTLEISGCIHLKNSISFGEYTFWFPDTAKPDRKTDDGYCVYSISNSSFNFEPVHEGLSIEPMEITSATLEFEYLLSEDKPRNVSVIWEGSISFDIGLLHAHLSKLNYSINPFGELSGNIDFQISLNRDIKVKEVICLRKGVTGKVSLSFSNAEDWSDGLWNFAGISNIHFDLIKNKTIIATATGSFSSEGVLASTLTAMPGGKTYQSKGFTVEVPPNKLTINFTYDISSTEIEIIDGTGTIRVKNIIDLNGSIDMQLAINQDKMTTAINSTKLSAFGMEFSNVSLIGSLDMHFELDEFRGELDAKHPDFDSVFEDIIIIIQEGSLKTFSISHAIMCWKLFDVIIDNAAYSYDKGLAFNIALIIDGIGYIAIDEFVIDKSGNITMNEIAGAIDRQPVNVSFSAKFDQNHFSGLFQGQFTGNIGINGMVKIGVIEKNPKFTYAYLKLEVGTNISLGTSGLKIKEISGEFGYNYDASLTADGSSRYSKGTHTIGFGLALSDHAELMMLGGYIKLVLGNATKMELKGNLQVTANTEYFAGDLVFMYIFGKTDFSVLLDATLKIPSDGSIIHMEKCTATYEVKDKKWYYSGEMKGIFFDNQDISIEGMVNLHGALSKPIKSMRGFLDGSIKASLNYEIVYPKHFDPTSCDAADDTDTIWGFGMKGEYSIHIESSTNISLKDNGVTGYFTIYVFMSSEAKVKWPCFFSCGDDCVSLYTMSSEGRLTAQQDDENFRIKGELVFVGGGNTSKGIDIDIAF